MVGDLQLLYNVDFTVFYYLTLGSVKTSKILGWGKTNQWFYIFVYEHIFANQ